MPVLSFFISLSVSLSLGTFIKGPNQTIEFGKSASLWCGLDEGFETCQWTTPDDTSCRFESESDPCLVKPDFHLNPEPFHGKTNCSIAMPTVNDMHNGEWQCKLDNSPTENLDLYVAKRAKISLGAGFPNEGPLFFVADRPMNLTCNATNGRPKGKFRWEIVEKGSRKAVRERSKLQTLHFVPQESHDGATLKCIYEQRNKDKGLIFKPLPGASITLKATYIRQEALHQIPSDAKVGNIVEITSEYEADPMPKAEDILVEIVHGEEKVIQVSVKDSEHEDYSLSLISDECTSTVTFTIKDIKGEEMSKNHNLIIKYPSSNLAPEVFPLRLNISNMEPKTSDSWIARWMPTLIIIII
ncbi:hypothetical protein TCAL_15543, partial [Tigriopus californicus]